MAHRVAGLRPGRRKLGGHQLNDLGIEGGTGGATGRDGDKPGAGPKRTTTRQKRGPGPAGTSADHEHVSGRTLVGIGGTPNPIRSPNSMIRCPPSGASTAS